MLQFNFCQLEKYLDILMNHDLILQCCYTTSTKISNKLCGFLVTSCNNKLAVLFKQYEKSEYDIGERLTFSVEDK